MPTRKLFANPNPHTVYVRDADGCEVPVEPWARARFFKNPVTLVVEGDVWEEPASRGQLAPIDEDVVGDLPVRGEHLPEETPLEEKKPIIPEAVPAEELPGKPEEKEDPAAPQVDYTQFKKRELQAMCEERGLAQSGNRDDLIARIVNDDDAS